MPRRKKRVFGTWEHSSLHWLAKEAKINESVLGSVLTQCRMKTLSKNLYHKVKVSKRDGGKRIISVPDPDLLRVQKAVNRHILKDLPSNQWSFGFSGGSITDAIKPHLKNKVLYSFDIVNAFGQISKEYLWKVLGDDFSRPIKTILFDLAFWEYDLPQGSAVSPRLFDYAFSDIDARIARLANKLGGVYTRYADNIFFSLPKDRFPRKLQSAVLRRVKTKYGDRIQCHEFSVRRLDKGAVKILGLNIINGEITATREFKRNLRLAVHHVKYLIDHNLPYDVEWARLQGQMSFGRLGFLPTSLKNSYASLEERVRELSI